MKENLNPLLNMRDSLPSSAAAGAADTTADGVMTDAEKRRIRRNALIKMLIIIIFVACCILFGSIAWFTQNREAGSGGMGIKVQAMPYSILTRDSSGYYSSVYESLNSDGMEWKISSGCNFDNHENAKKEGETEPGLEPGDCGTLEFRVHPNSADSITVNCVFDIKCFLETTTTVNETTVTEVTEIHNSALVGYVKAHIMLFADFDSVTGKYSGLIGNDESLRRVLENQTYSKNQSDYTKIYWVWPEHLSDLIDSESAGLIYDSAECTDVIEYIASNKNGFFKDCNDSAAKVKADLTALLSSYSNSTYNHYNMKYDNADLDIGNNVSYVLLSMQVE